MMMMLMMLLIRMLQLVSKGCPKENHIYGRNRKAKGGDMTEWQCVDVHSGLFTFLCVYTCFSSICYNVMLVVG